MRKLSWAERALAALNDYTCALAGAVALNAVLETIVAHAGRTFNCQAVILLPTAEWRLAPAAASPGGVLTSGEQAVACLAAAETAYRWGAGVGQTAESDDATNLTPAPEIVCCPLRTPGGTLGVLCLTAARLRAAAATTSLLEIFCHQAALAIERARLADRTPEIELLRSTEKLQAALLNSLTHDLRTPLAIITVALSNLETNGERLDEVTRQALARTGREEAERLNRRLSDLLEISRIEAGALRVTAELCDVEELIAVALDHLAPQGGWPGLTMVGVAEVDERPVAVELAPDLPAVRLDLALMAQALINVLDNAVKYSPPGTQIDIRARVAGGEVEIAVANRGSALPAEDLAHIFDKFFRGQQGDGTSGSGLGLAISKGIVEAHGGRIWAAARDGGGMVVTMALPVPPATAAGAGRD